jgi:hypothetical protein
MQGKIITASKGQGKVRAQGGRRLGIATKGDSKGKPRNKAGAKQGAR